MLIFYSVLPAYNEHPLSELRLRASCFEVLGFYKTAEGGVIAERDPLPGIVSGNIASHHALDSICSEDNVGTCRGTIRKTDLV